MSLDPPPVRMLSPWPSGSVTNAQTTPAGHEGPVPQSLWPAVSITTLPSSSQFAGLSTPAPIPKASIATPKSAATRPNKHRFLFFIVLIVFLLTSRFQEGQSTSGGRQPHKKLAMSDPPDFDHPRNPPPSVPPVLKGCAV